MSPFNRAAWDGEKPLVEPIPSTIDIGSVVWTRSEYGPHDSPRIGGMVVRRRIDTDTGELETVTVITKTRADGQFRIASVDLNAADLDPNAMQPPTPHRLHRVAREICLFLGGRASGYITGWDRWLLETAGGLVALADELHHSEAA